VIGEGCIQFGPDVTATFLRRSRLRLLIRSHELPPRGRGYAVQHEGRCLTIFSASNYNGCAGNAGAVLVWSPPAGRRGKGKLDVVEHMAPSGGRLAAARAQGGAAVAALAGSHASTGEQWQAARRMHVSSGGERGGDGDGDGEEGEGEGGGGAWEVEVGGGADLDEKVLRLIRERVVRHKPRLRLALGSEMRAREPGVPEGRVSAAAWARAMEGVVPWAKQVSIA
jgi:hypothetical protein